MFRLDHINDKFELHFVWGDKSDHLFRALQDAKLVEGGVTVGTNAVLQLPVNQWNVDTINAHCRPIAKSKRADVQLRQVALPVNVPGSPLRKVVPSVTDWKFYREPFTHQIHSFNWAVAHPYTALLLDMGLGKTFVVVNVLDYFRKVKKMGLPSLVVIPLSSFETWESEFEKCGSDAKVVRVLGGRQRKIDLLNSEADVYLITYDTLRSLVDSDEPCIVGRPFGYIVLDESTKIKNANSARAKALYKIRDQAKRRMILSGYPVTQSYTDIFGQYKFLDVRVFGMSLHRFKNRYCVMGGFQTKQVVGYTRTGELTQYIYTRAIMYKKEECLDLPPKTYATYRFELSPVERKAYDQMKKHLVLQFFTGTDPGHPIRVQQQVSAQNALVASLRLVQICSGFVGGVKEIDEDEGTVLKDIGESKRKLLAELLEDEVPKGDSSIVWVRFKHDMEAVVKTCEALGISYVTFHGGLSANERIERIQRYQAGDVRVFIGILQAGGHGLTLTRASYVIYYSQDYSVERRKQSEDRAHRIGQTKNVTYITLTARGTVEESILKIIAAKGKAAEYIVSNPEGFLSGTL